jgi:hypothetical protein
MTPCCPLCCRPERPNGLLLKGVIRNSSSEGFGAPGSRDHPLMPASAAEHALIRAYIACNLARDALPELPQDTAAAVEDAVRTFCNVVGEELKRTHPDAIDA